MAPEGVLMVKPGLIGDTDVAGWLVVAAERVIGISSHPALTVRNAATKTETIAIDNFFMSNIISVGV